ncbi:MAG: NfeD family protein [Clostridiales bacterium]|jgi:membrane protein implicated in regulation of membrane protease activity|nr:NfeD family protein [Clostridiales bacterium]
MTMIWLFVAIAAIVLEVITVQMVAIWFAPAAIVSLLLSLLGVNEIVQIVVFVVISALLVIFLYGKIRKNIAEKSEKTNIDAIIGADAIAEEDFGGDVTGRVKIKDMSWKASCEENVEKGQKLTVKKIEGVTVVCAVKNTAKVN